MKSVIDTCAGMGMALSRHTANPKQLSDAMESVNNIDQTIGGLPHTRLSLSFCREC